MDTSKHIQVVENINEALMTCELSENIGLHAGTSGIALFLAYYNRIIRQKTEVSPRVMEILEHNINLIESGVRLHTICSGISGFGWLCEHLRQLSMLNKADTEFLDDLDFFLYVQMMSEMKAGIYDFLHGALGVGFYFISRFDRKDVQQYLYELLAELEKTATPCENGGVKWISILNGEPLEKGYNISLSHGMSSIAAFFIRLHQLNFETERVDQLLTGTITYILDQEIHTKGNVSCFPSHSKESDDGNYYSRLGWCYGDLGIATILWQAAAVLKNKAWENTAIRILRHNCKRRSLTENGIRDAGLCHGSAGIAHIFWNMYLNTHLQEFRETADYWMDVTMQMAKYDDGIAGFMTWRTEKLGGPVKETDLLEGIAGIGLAILSHLNIHEMDWDKCLMLSK